MSNDFFCNYYDQGLFIGSTPHGQNTIAMCCWQEKMITDTITFDHSYLQSSRTQSQSHVPDKCSRLCKHANHHNERIRATQESYWDNSGQKIKKLHLEQSLICNLTCISCSSAQSSAWNTHYHLFDNSKSIIRLKKYPEHVWENLDLSELSHIHFTGGEPLLNPDNLKILQHLDNIGRLHSVSLTYNTNGTVRPVQEWIDLWTKAKWVRLHFSLDGVGSTFEYTRYPAAWAQVHENIQWFRQLQGPCVLIEVNAIVGLHNVFNMPEFFHWWQHNCQTGNQGDPSHIFARAIEPTSHGGKVLSLKYLPREFKQQAVDVLQSLKELPGSTELIFLLCKEDSTQWLEYFEKLDQIRGTNWKQCLQGLIKDKQ